MPEPPTLHTLRLTRVFAAPRERVFAAWTEPEEIRKWWGPEGFTCLSAESDPRPGGRYRIEIRGGEKDETFCVTGEYVEVVPPERLVYTFRWERGDWEYPETLVTVEFHDRGGRTELVLTHERFPEEKMRDDHGEGWTSCLDCLERFLADG